MSIKEIVERLKQWRAEVRRHHEQLDARSIGLPDRTRCQSELRLNAALDELASATRGLRAEIREERELRNLHDP